MRLRTLRLVAFLLPAALLVHELAYALVGGGLVGAHHYLEVLIPLAAAIAAAVTFASLIMPALGAAGGRPQPFAPLAIAGALLGIFVVQELAEATLLGGGSAGLAASLSVAWMAPPLALLIGALAGAVIVALDRAGRLLAAPAPHRPRPARGAPLQAAPIGPSLHPLACRGLSFGFARRPPPTLAPLT